MFKKIENEAQAFEIVGFTPDLEKFKALGLPERYVQPLYDGFVLELVIEANNKLNGDWKADWADDDQYKYFVENYVEEDASKPAGFGFTDTYYDDWNTNTGVGERLTVGSAEQALYLGTQFRHLYESKMLIIREKEKV